MRKRPAETRSHEAALDGMRPRGNGAVNILVAGIPKPPLLGMIQSRHPGNLNLYVAETRPYEEEVARAIAAFPASGVRVSIVTDNMIAALLQTVPIRAVWSQYLERDGECLTAINGAHMAALLARAYEIPCLLSPISGLPPGESGVFAGEDIAVPGAACLSWEPDIVPLELVSEVVEP
jgi:hypothetical protein